jgi:hypothetical protein
MGNEAESCRVFGRDKLNGKKKRVKEKPTYWRGYIAQWETAK